MKKLLYINNYNCPVRKDIGITNNHMWGIDKLAEKYDVTYANVPNNIIKVKFKGVTLINNILRNFILLVKYFKFPIVYSACGDMTTAFAFANYFHLGKRKLYMIQHHGGVKIWFSGSYSSVMFISPIIANCYKLSNKKIINWGGCPDYAKHFISNTPILTYDFISAGKSGRDHECMIKAANQINAKTIIITGYNKTLYDKSKITIISGNSAQKNSMKYDDVYKLYTQSRFIVIPVRKKNGKACYSLSGLTTFVDAAVLNKPILISDNTNIGVDVEKLGIGLSYHAGDENDMKRKMETLLSLSNEQYYEMCSNMRTLSHKYTYDCFCKQILEIIN